MSRGFHCMEQWNPFRKPPPSVTTERLETSSEKHGLFAFGSFQLILSHIILLNYFGSELLELLWCPSHISSHLLFQPKRSVSALWNWQFCRLFEVPRQLHQVVQAQSLILQQRGGTCLRRARAVRATGPINISGGTWSIKKKRFYCLVYSRPILLGSVRTQKLEGEKK